MNREVHVRFWEGVGVKFSRATQLRTIPSAGRGVASWTPCRIASPFGVPSLPHRRGDPVAHSTARPPAPTRSRDGSLAPPSLVAAPQALSHAASFGSPCARRHRLDHCQSSARPTSLARRALRSIYRATVRKCASVCTGKDLKRPW